MKLKVLLARKLQLATVDASLKVEIGLERRSSYCAIATQHHWLVRLIKRNLSLADNLKHRFALQNRKYAEVRKDIKETKKEKKSGKARLH